MIFYNLIICRRFFICSNGILSKHKILFRESQISFASSSKKSKSTKKKSSITLLQVDHSGVHQMTKKVKEINKNTLERAMANISLTTEATLNEATLLHNSEKNIPKPNEDFTTNENPPEKKKKKSKTKKNEEVLQIIQEGITSAKKNKKNVESFEEICANIEVLARLGERLNCQISHLYYHSKSSTPPTHEIFVSILRNWYVQKKYFDCFDLHGYLNKGKFIPNETIYAYLLSSYIKGEELFTNYNRENKSYGEIYNTIGFYSDKHVTYATILLDPHSRTLFVLDGINELLKSMEKHNISIDDVFNEAEFIFDMKNKTLEAIKKINSDYSPPVKKLCYTPEYSPVLLKHLNTRQNYGSTEAFRSNVFDLNGNEDKSTSPYTVSLDNINEQLHITELKRSVCIKSIYDGSCEGLSDPWLKNKLVPWKKHWREKLSEVLLTDINVMNRKLDSLDTAPWDVTVRPYIMLLGVDNVVDAMIEEIDKLSTTSQILAEYRLQARLGKRLHSYYLRDHREYYGVDKKREEIYHTYCKLFEKHAEEGINLRVAYNQLCDELNDGIKLDSTAPHWPYSLLRQLGRYLYNVMVSNVFIWLPAKNGKVTQYPALSRREIFEKYYSREAIEAHPLLVKLYRLDQELVFTADELPMVSPPIPWTTGSEGGYFSMPNDVVRVRPSEVIKTRSRLSDESFDIKGPMDSLNVLGSVPWKINEPLLDIVIKLFNSNAGEDLDIPPHPSTLAKPSIDEKETPLEAQYYKKKHEMNSLWCTALYKLSIANHFRNKVMWFPHNMDFRGRAYPIHPHLSQVDSDVFRSLLLFANKKPLGERGLEWLKTHLINLTGLCKHSSLSARLAYCDEVMPLIIDSADRPLEGERWWSKSDEPWQTLSACMELRAALQCSNPTEFLSSLPIHQDGSCNGLQHYAALGRDREGAKSVNLMPSEVPQDVYVAVANLVDKIRKKEAAEGNEMAILLDGFVRRKVVKQTIMTTVYGVTSFGATAQVEKQLKVLDDFPQDKIRPAARYLTKAIFSSLQQMFTSARKIQDWLTDCADVITKVRGESVQWVTPIGLPILQPYMSPLKVTKLNQMVPAARSCAVSAMELPKTVKQKNAFPPNFVHSLDATHMMLTSLHCAAKGITFASVHDCYWTHACNVDQMNEICREQFVDLYSQPILHDLSNYFNKVYNFSEFEYSHDGSSQDTQMYNLKRTLEAVPRLGKFDIQQVKGSTFFFS